MIFGTVTIANADGTDREVTLTKPTVTIGRASSCDIVLNDLLAADEHAQIVSNAQSSEFVALVDSVRTKVDGKPAARGQPIRLKALSRLFIGGSSLIFRRAAEASLLEQMLRSVEGRVTPPLGTRIPVAAPPPAAADTVIQRPASATPAIVAAVSAASAPTQAIQTDQLNRDAGTLIVMTIKERPKNERVRTDQSITYVIEVTNRSETVDSAYITVEGIPGTWVTVLPERRALHPERSGEFAIQIHPPRNSKSSAGLHRAVIVARFSTQQSARTSNEIAFTVERFDDFKLEPLEPESQRAWRQAHYVFNIKNDSNHIQEFSIKGRERERAIEFRCRPAVAKVDPGESQEIQVQGLITRSQQRFFGESKDFNFTISVTPEHAPVLDTAGAPEPTATNVQQLTGTLVQQPPLSQWVSVAALLITVFVCLCVAITAALARYAPTVFNPGAAIINQIVPITTQAPPPTAILPTAPLPPTFGPLPTLVPLPTLAPLDTLVPLATLPPPPDIDATFAPLKTQAAQELIAKKTEIAGQSDGQKTALAQQYVITATLIAISQAQTGTAITDSYAQTSTAIAQANAQTSTAVAQANATQIALQQTQFSGTQTAQSLYATQTEAARPTNTFTPTPSNTPSPAPTSIADVVVNFVGAAGTPVVERTQVEGNEFFQQDVSICLFGQQAPTEVPTEVPTVVPTIPTQPAPITPEPIPSEGGDINVFRPAAIAPVVRCHPPSILRYNDEPELLPAMIYPGKVLNLNVPFLTADTGDGQFRSQVFGVITFQTEVTDVRIEMFHVGPGRVTYYTPALDESGALVGNAQRVLEVRDPYTLIVTASKPIRQVLIFGTIDASDKSLLSYQAPWNTAPLVITQVEANFRRR